MGFFNKEGSPRKAQDPIQYEDRGETGLLGENSGENGSQGDPYGIKRLIESHGRGLLLPGYGL